MPRWIYQSEPAQASPGEQSVAESLSTLGDDFIIRWGFFYNDEYGISREGDFIIQGPDGHLLVMECKGGEISCDESTGRWNTADAVNPFVQLDREWAGVLRLLNNQADQLGCVLPFVDHVVVLPDMHPASGAATYLGQPRDKIVGAEDLQKFAKWWEARFSKRALQCDLKEARHLFLSVYAASMPAGATSHALDFADRVMEKQIHCRFEILSALRENRQLLVRGGPGTGKTWLAIEQAVRWGDEGFRVLFLCYNLELEAWLRPICKKRSKLIDVLSYEGLAKEFGITHPADCPPEKLSEFFDIEVPKELLQQTGTGEFQPQYDALVVDEAQDHNTGEPENVTDRAGWWTIYLRLLKEGGEARVGIFYDSAQRLPLRQGRFDIDDLSDCLMAPVRVTLDRPLRYTRQLQKYFADLYGETKHALLQDFTAPTPGLPDGPDPEICQAENDHEEAKVCANLVKEWISRGLARPHEIVLLFPSKRSTPAWIGKVHGVLFSTDACPPKEAIRAIAIHRAKGLERRAVIVVGFAPWTQIQHDAYQSMTYVLGVTRCQHLLAVVERIPRSTPDEA